MLKPRRGLESLILCTITALSFVVPTSATVEHDECLRAEGCIAGLAGGQATFQVSGDYVFQPMMSSGNFIFTDASAGVSVTSSNLFEYGLGSTDSERILSFRIEDGVYSEARVFLTDSGPSSADFIRIQLLDSVSVPVKEFSGILLEACGGGISYAESCVPPVPCELKVTVTCAVAGSQTPGASGECLVSGSL